MSSFSVCFAKNQIRTTVQLLWKYFNAECAPFTSYPLFEMVYSFFLILLRSMQNSIPQL